MGKRRADTPTRKENSGKVERSLAKKKRNYNKMVAKMKKRNPDYAPKWKDFEAFHEASKVNGKKGYENHLRVEAQRRSEIARRKAKNRPSDIDRTEEDKE